VTSDDAWQVTSTLHYGVTVPDGRRGYMSGGLDHQAGGHARPAHCGRDELVPTCPPRRDDAGRENSDGRTDVVGPEPGDEIEIEDVDVEALTDEAEPLESLVDAPGLGVDLPEADVLDQRREAPSDEADEPR
jgi:hypothetical protein